MKKIGVTSDPGGSSKSTNGMVKGSKIQRGKIWINLTSDRSARHPDSNGVDDTQIRVQVRASQSLCLTWTRDRRR